jgi:tetratricopeptide (TPR) repeat protein
MEILMNYIPLILYTLFVIRELLLYKKDRKPFRFSSLTILALAIFIYTPLSDSLSSVPFFRLRTVMFICLIIYGTISAIIRHRNRAKRQGLELAIVLLMIFIPIVQVAVQLFLYTEGTSLNKSGNYEAAINYYDKVLAVDKRANTVYDGKGQALTKLKKYDEAIQWFSRIMSSMGARNNTKIIEMAREQFQLVKEESGKA